MPYAPTPLPSTTFGQGAGPSEGQGSGCPKNAHGNNKLRIMWDYEGWKRLTPGRSPCWDRDIVGNGVWRDANKWFETARIGAGGQCWRNWNAEGDFANRFTGNAPAVLGFPTTMLQYYAAAPRTLSCPLHVSLIAAGMHP